MKSAIAFAVAAMLAVGVGAQQTPPTIPFDSSTDFLRYSPDMNLGEVLGVAVNSKGHIVVLNHPGNATSGPLYGNASTQLLEFDQTGKFVREIGKGVYGLGYSHSVRFDRYDNLWVVDKGTNAVVKFNPAGYVTLNLGRRPEGPDDPAESYYRPGRRDPLPHVDGMFRQPTDVAWDSDDNIYVSDGYTNARVAKFDKNGNWVKAWGVRGNGPGQFNIPHTIAADAKGNIYVGDRTNERIQVFDGDGTFLRQFTGVAQPWAICITPGPNQVLYSSDANSGKIFKLDLTGQLLGELGSFGKQPKQFGWVHEIACPSENELYVGELLNWRMQKLVLRPPK